MKIQISGLEKWKSNHHRLYIINVCTKLEPVLASPEWSKSISSASYSQANGYSSLKILNLILSGADDQHKIPDGDIDLDCYEFWRLSNTVAYTYLGDYRTFFNSYILNKRMKSGLSGESQLAATIMHELMHRAFNFTHHWPMGETVPYKVGAITAESYRNFYNSGGAKDIYSLTDRPIEFNFFGGKI